MTENTFSSQKKRPRVHTQRRLSLTLKDSEAGLSLSSEFRPVALRHRLLVVLPFRPALYLFVSNFNIDFSHCQEKNQNPEPMNAYDLSYYLIFGPNSPVANPHRLYDRG